MFTGLDHIIIGVSDLEQATQTFQRLGLLASGGGIHPVGGTANRIIVIGDTYLELITVRKPDEAQQSLLERLAKGDGYLNCVFASDTIEEDSEAILERGISIIGPNAGSLTSENGRSRGWIRTDIERPDLAQQYPFLIQHDSCGQERREKLAGWTTPPIHPLGAIQVHSATLAVQNLDEATGRFQQIYALQPSEPYTEAGGLWNARLVAFPLNGRSQSFELASPPDARTLADTVYLPETGALEHLLQQNGENLCRITLFVEDLAASRRYLDEHNITYMGQTAPFPLLWIHPENSCGAPIVLREAKS